MTKKIYLETLKSVLGRSILHYCHFQLTKLEYKNTAEKQTKNKLRNTIWFSQVQPSVHQKC